MLTIAFQGEKGAYSEAAALAYFNDKIQTIPCVTFDDVFQKVISGECAHGVVPIENTLAGSIHRNYDLLLRHSLSIVGEKIFRVQHCLIAQPGVALKNIRLVMSHPQALAQCENYLHKLGVTQEVWYDTAGAVKSLAESKELDKAAIASKRAAEVYGMQVLAEGIEDEKINYTRFLILAPKDAEPPAGSAKTSIVFSLHGGGGHPGSLFRALSAFALRDINLTKIESRPDPQRSFEYVFYLDFVGSAKEPRCLRAIEHLREMSNEVRVLGSYVADRNWNK